MCLLERDRERGIGEFWQMSGECKECVSVGIQICRRVRAARYWKGWEFVYDLIFLRV